jgi:Carboxypeptidase regulatory-like domain
MKANVPRLPPYLLFLFLATATAAAYPQSGATVSGVVTSAAGEPIPHARVSAKNLNTGQSTELQADSSGHFDFSTAAPADFEVTVSADGFDPKVTRITFAPGAVETMTVALTAIPGWTPPAQTNLPNAPSSSQTTPSLSDLGFTPEQIRMQCARAGAA